MREATPDHRVSNIVTSNFDRLHILDERLNAGRVDLGVYSQCCSEGGHVRVSRTGKMICRIGCGACCIAPSISSPLPGAPNGKGAGERCLHLAADNTCRIHGRPDYPAVCRDFTPSPGTCGESFEEALSYLTELEAATRPEKSFDGRIVFVLGHRQK